MKIPALILSIALLALTAAAKVDDDLLFLRALGEHDPARRSEALLTLAERGGRHTAELALIHLTRTPLPAKSLPRLSKLARSGDLIPTVLLARAFRAEETDLQPEPMPRRELYRLAHASWQNAGARKLSPFEERLFRELSGEVLKLAWECGETAQLFPEVEKRLSDGEREWHREFPLAELLEFCCRHAFTAEGFELYSPEWISSASPGRRIFATLFTEATVVRISDDRETAARIAFLQSIDEYDKAILLAAEQVEKSRRDDRFGPKVNRLVGAVVGSGKHWIFDELRPFLKPAAVPGLKALTLVNGGKFREALEMLPQITDAPLRAQVELTCRLALGEFDAAVALATDPASALDKRPRMLVLLEIAQTRGDKAVYAAAERLGGDEIDTDPSLANAFGYVALVLGLDREKAEQRIRYALKIKPHTGAFLDSLAWARHLAGDHAGAWKLMEEALRCSEPLPENCELLAHAGAIRLALGDRDGARSFCRKALALAQEGEKNPRRKPHIRPFADNIRKQLEQLK